MSVHRRADRDGYVVRWRDSEGRNRSRTFTVHREAKEFDREMKQLERGAREARALRQGLEAAKQSTTAELREMAKMLADELDGRAAAMGGHETAESEEPEREEPSDVIERAGRILAKAARSPARVILFGSAARGDADPGSDLDFLVIEREVDDRVAEAVRLRSALGDIGAPVDVIVLDEALAERRAKVPGTMVHHAFRDGRLIAQS